MKFAPRTYWSLGNDYRWIPSLTKIENVGYTAEFNKGKWKIMSDNEIIKTWKDDLLPGSRILIQFAERKQDSKLCFG